MRYDLGPRRIQLRGTHHYVAPNATLVGDVILEDRASVWFNVVIRADNEPITVGERSNVQDGSVLHTDEGVPMSLGPSVTVGHMVMLHGCTVGEGSLIGIKAVVLNHAVIGRECLIGANALVGGSARSFALQPVSVEGQTGLDVSAGLATVNLQYAP